MSVRNIGYCCINLTVGHLKTSRDIKKATWLTPVGIELAVDCGIKNAIDILEILKWNELYGIKSYRMSSNLLPWMSEYEICDLPRFDELHQAYKNIGNYVKLHNHRVTFHPGHFNVIASLREDVVQKSIIDLSRHGEIMDLMGLDRSPFYAINIHINSLQPSKPEACERFVQTFSGLPLCVTSRLTLENDDSPNQYGVQDLYDGICKFIKVPIVLDFLHYEYGPDCNSKLPEMMSLAFSTWGNITPLTHMSSTRQLEEPKARKIAHADYIYNLIPEHQQDFDCELECKAKDLALFKYQNELQNLAHLILK